MSAKGNLKISMVETSLSDTDLQKQDYGVVSTTLQRRGFEIFYECQTSTLTEFQRRLYNKVLVRAPKRFCFFLDPLIISFVLRDACDVSEVDYVWIYLDDGGEIGCSAGLRREDQNEGVNLAMRLLDRHLEKYVIDTYDRRTREDMLRVWETQLNLKECPTCANPSLTRTFTVIDHHKFRGWICSACAHHVILHIDVLSYLEQKAAKISC
jgi:hypothetical protein